METFYIIYNRIILYFKKVLKKNLNPSGQKEAKTMFRKFEKEFQVSNKHMKRLNFINNPRNPN